MTGAAADLLAVFGLLILYGMGVHSPLLFAATGALAILGRVSLRRERAAQEEQTLREHGLKRIRVGRDVIYLERRDDE